MCLHAIRDNTLTQGIAPDLLLGTINGTGIKIAGQDHNCTLADTEVTVTITHTGVTLDHITDATTGALHNTSTPTLHCYHCDTPHQRSSSHRCSSPHSRHHSKSRPCTPYKPSKNTSFKSSSSSSRTTVKPQDKKHRRVSIYDPQSDYYSSDDTSSDSEDDFN